MALADGNNSRRGSVGNDIGPTSAKSRRRREYFSGWLFATPALIGVGIFLLVPIGMALWVSFRDWNGIGPVGSSTAAGAKNYGDLLTTSGLAQSDFAISLRNNFYFVIGVVPAQTALSLFLAVLLNHRWLRGRTFFRSVLFFPSVVGSIAISLIFIFLFQPEGLVNTVARVRGFQWLSNAGGLLHGLLGLIGVDAAPEWTTNHSVLGLPLWDWLAGPSAAMTSLIILVTWTSSGVFMLIFLAGLQTIPQELNDAAGIDGANAWQRFRWITLPMLRPTVFLVVTLGVIGSWQLFDQVFVVSEGGPEKTTLTPAFLVYREGFTNFNMGGASAIAFLLFLIIIGFTLVQRAIVNRGASR